MNIPGEHSCTTCSEAAERDPDHRLVSAHWRNRWKARTARKGSRAGALARGAQPAYGLNRNTVPHGFSRLLAVSCHCQATGPKKAWTAGWTAGPAPTQPNTGHARPTQRQTNGSLGVYSPRTNYVTCNRTCSVRPPGFLVETY